MEKSVGMKNVHVGAEKNTKDVTVNRVETEPKEEENDHGNWRRSESKSD